MAVVILLSVEDVLAMTEMRLKLNKTNSEIKKKKL